MDDASAFLTSRMRLKPEHAVAAILQVEDGRYVLQLRDSNPKIFYPDHWGCFGGAMEQGETPVDTILRELDEELGLQLREADCTYFTEFTFDFDFAGFGIRRRYYYSVVLPQATLDGMVLTEGAKFDAFPANVALSTLPLTPYDAFAVWMHHHRDRLLNPLGRKTLSADTSAPVQQV